MLTKIVKYNLTKNYHDLDANDEMRNIQIIKTWLVWLGFFV